MYIERKTPGILSILAIDVIISFINRVFGDMESFVVVVVVRRVRQA